MLLDVEKVIIMLYYSFAKDRHRERMMGEESKPAITGADTPNTGVAAALIALLGREISAGGAGHRWTVAGMTVKEAMQVQAEGIKLPQTLQKIQLVRARANQRLLGKRDFTQPVKSAKVVAFLRPGDEIDAFLPLLGV
jgi:hypothetical protein